MSHPGSNGKRPAPAADTTRADSDDSDVAMAAGSPGSPRKRKRASERLDSHYARKLQDEEDALFARGNHGTSASASSSASAHSGAGAGLSTGSRLMTKSERQDQELARRLQLEEGGDPEAHCNFFATPGGCRNGDLCPFMHDTTRRTAQQQQERDDEQYAAQLADTARRTVRQQQQRDDAQYAAQLAAADTAIFSGNAVIDDYDDEDDDLYGDDSDEEEEEDEDGQGFPEALADTARDDRTAVTKMMHAERLSEDEKSCVICLGDYENGEEIRRLPCFHFFHRPCVDQHFKNQDRCPICRTAVK